MLVEPLERLKGLRLFTKYFGIYFVLALILFLLYCATVNDVPNSSFIVPGLDVADNTKHLSFLCHETFNQSLEDNLKVIQNYPRGIADNFLWKIGGNMSEPFRMKKFPVFATAINRQYLPLSQGLFKSLHRRLLANPKYGKDVLIIVYDLGLTARQLKIVIKHCRCQVRRFPFDQFPPHVKELHTYAFKPIIVQDYENSPATCKYCHGRFKPANEAVRHKISVHEKD